MEKQTKTYRLGRGGSSQFHELMRSDRTITRTYKMTQQLADDIARLADQFQVSSSDLVFWCLQRSIRDIEIGAIAPKVESVVKRCVLQ